MNLAFADPTEWWLEIWPHLQAEYWQASQVLATPTRRISFYLNQLCLNVFLPWFQTEYAPDATAWPNRNALRSIWEVVNGIGIAMPSKRLVLIPTEALDGSELEVPQEWVDIPTWAADYYLAIQINLEDPWVRVWGYTTHQRLKQRASYDASDRTYCLAGRELIRDLNTFWNIQHFCPTAETRAAVAPLPNLSAPQAETLIQQLSQPGVVFPRMAAPFKLWGALLEREDWRRQLYQERLSALRGKAAAVSPIVNLSQWFQHQFEAGWRPIEALLGTDALTLAPLRMPAVSSESIEQRVKRIPLTAESAPQAVVLLMSLNKEEDGRVGVRVQIHPTRGNRYVPANLSLAIYSESSDLLLSIQSRNQDDFIQLPHFRCVPGTQFRLQVTLDDDRFSENFAV